MQKLCSQDPSGKGEHCFCIDIDTQRGVKKCCKCNQWNVQGNDWTNDEDLDNFKSKHIKIKHTVVLISQKSISDKSKD